MHRPQLLHAFAVACCVLLAGSAAIPRETLRSGDRQPTRVEQVEGLAMRLDGFVARHAAYGFSGTVLVSETGRVLLHKGYGYADRAQRTPITTATVFPFGSVTKQFTASAIYKLEAEGKLKTTDPISKYLRGVPQSSSAITIIQLLTHSAGLSREADNHADLSITREEFVANVLRLPLQSRPGESYNYSNAGYGLLAAIVEEVTGRTFESYLREELLRPAGLSHTGWRSEFDSRLFARGYQDMLREGGSEVTLPPLPSWFFLGSGSLVGTVEDLHKWNETLNTDRVLTADARKRLFTPAFDDYVNGWWMTKTKRGEEVSYSDGDVPGYQTVLVRLPKLGEAIVIAVNNDAGWGRLMSRGLQDVLAGEKYDLPPTVVALGDVQLSKLAGRYELPSGATFDVRASEGALLIDANGQEAVNLLAGADSAGTVQCAAANAWTVEVVERLKRGDFDGLKSVTEFQSPAPLERLRDFWATMIRNKGALKSSQIVGTTLARGERTQTLVRFELERGAELWLLIWQGGKLRGWDINVAAPGANRFLPTSAMGFAALDIVTRRVTRISFRADAGGQVVALSTVAQDAEKEARKMPGASAVSASAPIEETPPRRIDLPRTVAVPLLEHNHRPVVEARIDGKGPYRLAIETGARIVGLTPRVVAELGLQRVGGPDDEPLVHVASVSVGRARFEDVTAVQFAFGDTSIDGILGLNVFATTLVTLDPKAHIVRFERGGLPAIDGREILTLRPIGSLVGVDVTIGGKPFVACVDTRGAGTLTMMPALAESVQFEGALRAAGQARGAAIPATPRQIGRLASDVRLGVYTIQRSIVFVHATPADFPQVPILGCELLRQFTLTLDQAHSRIRFSRAERVLPPAPESELPAAGK